MGGVVSSGVDNDELVDKLKEAEYIKSARVEKVFRLVDRGFYLTKENQNVAYRDNAWRCGNLHLSAPCIYAQVMEGLEFGAGMSFLNIGSGTGYLSTMAGLLIGPNGINHGVEIHSDLIEYAKERLNWLIGNTGTVDVLNFCIPQFSQGNGLCLREDTQLYDRVYCGASCPSSHEEYMKNLIKVNGILVMPRNEKLLKITRVSKTVWAPEELLPVSFSSLVLPNQYLAQESVELPPVQIASLQELTREVIRSIFRSLIEAENEDLKTSFIHAVTSPPRTKDPTQLKGRVVPSFHRISISNDSSGSDDPDEPVDSVQRIQTSHLSAFIELARSLGMNRSVFVESRRIGENGDDDEEEAEGEQEEEDNDEMVVDEDYEEVGLFEMIDRVTQEREGQAPRVEANQSAEKDEGNQSYENDIEEEEDLCRTPRKENKEKEDDENEITTTPVTVTNENGTEKTVAVTNAATSSVKDVHEEDKDEVKEDGNSSLYTASSNPQTDDEEMKEAESVSKTLNGKRLSKINDKRDKFDSGIVEDLDPALSMDSSSCSFHSRSNSSESSEDEDSRERTSAFPHQSEGRRLLWKKREANRRKRSNLKNDKENRTNSKAPIEKYSKLMKERISTLPLPSPLKVYINYNRPL